jgi:cystathionine beta-lyase
MTDSAYAPGRRFCQRSLARYGVETTFYDPLVGAGIEALIRPNTRVVYLESPGSHTFEVQDFPAIANVAHAHGAAVIHDNAWATGLFFRSFDHGADLVVQPATKYPSGHSECSSAWWRTRSIGRSCGMRRDAGQSASPTICSS